MTNDYDRNRRRYGKADDELVGFFSSAIGVKAQNLDSVGGGFNSHEAHWGRLQAMQRGKLAWFDRVAATVARLEPEHRRILVTIYTPHGAPTWLADALSPSWGGGSFVMLATTLPRAETAAAERNGESIAWPKRGVVRAQPKDGRTVLDWLIHRGRRAKDALLVSLREDAEELRVPALAAYDVLRVARVKAEQMSQREAAERRSERNLALYTELVGRKRRKERERLEARLRRAS